MLDPSDEGQIRIVVTKPKSMRAGATKNTEQSHKTEKNLRQPLWKQGVVDVETQQEGNARHHSQQSDPIYGLR